MHNVFADTCVGVTELKRKYTKILQQAQEQPVAALNHTRPEAYLLSAALYERMLAQLDDAQDARLVRERVDGPFIEVPLADL